MMETVGTRPEDPFMFSAFTADHVTLDRGPVCLSFPFVYKCAFEKSYKYAT